MLLGLVPLQITILPHLSLGGIRPDLCLVVSFLIGFLAGEMEGGGMGLALGFIQDLFSAGELWLNLVTKGGVGFLAGMLSRYVSSATPMLFLAALSGMSLISGLVFLIGGAADVNFADAVEALRLVLLPQAAYDAVAGAVAYWLIVSRSAKGGPLRREERIPLRR